MALNQLHPSREDLFAYRDGELKPDRRAVIEAHVLSCHICLELIDEVSGLEAELRSRAEAPGESYFERLTDQVMTRIQTGEAAPQMERRRSEAEMEWEAKRARAPRIPWLALISTASAAATVLVIAGLLIRQGAVLRKPPRPTVLERSAPDAARSRAKLDSLGNADKDAAGKKRGSRETASKEDQARNDQKMAARKELPKAEADRDLAAGQAAGKPAMQEEQPSHPGPADQGLFSKTSETKPKEAAGSLAAPSARAPEAANEAAPSIAADPRFAAFLLRYGLPPTWGPGVSDESVLRAEAALRNFYRTGGITSPVDSARARLYLAEAVRARESAPDSATAEEIIHHYQRAVRLSAGDAEVRRIAAQRLQDFLSERAQPR
jgi:hypothetical protein